MNKSIRKKIGVFLALSLSLTSLVGCTSSKKSEEVDSEKDTLVISSAGDIGNLNPHTYDSEMYAQDLVYEGLTKFEDGEVKPCLAEKWDISEDGKEYTFDLRDGVKFTDGSELNADIVKKNYDAVLLNKDSHSWIETLNQLKSVDVIDEDTIKFTFENAYYPVLQELALSRPMRIGAESIFPKDNDTSKGVNDTIGTGMWKIKEHKEGEYALFERNEDYWGEKPNFPNLKVKVIPDGNTAVNALKSGEIDMIFDIKGQLTADAFEELKGAGFKTEISEPSSTLAIAINTNKGATKDLKVRQAIQHAVDKDSIVKNVFYDLQPKADSLFARTTPYCDIDLTAFNYDKEKAIKLLDEAGWQLEDNKEYRTKDGETLKVDFYFDGESAVIKSVAQVIQNQFAEVGIKMEIYPEEYQSYATRQKDGSFDLIACEAWGDPFDPHSTVSSMRKASHADYEAQKGLEMKTEIDKTIESLLIEQDENKRQEMYTEVLTTLHNQAVYLTISYPTVLAAYSDDLEGIKFNTANYIPLQSVKRIEK